jgi:hypothetical protein
MTLKNVIEQAAPIHCMIESADTTTSTMLVVNSQIAKRVRGEYFQRNLSL